ncbi:hypothetical protein G6O69_07280 [Pseudenhygromyxa sp. WMMC2535]|uniref:hypothetical protein n=1 Tax=Pseudenhygromyxa sp. WMMC2535 TaxID=2712867 RepID=UPI00155833F8|nr:hypothetical protein [Pseudenhygromyxa sp. WMMC2535]NVB37629.1 hypothetical protein [Pseudenhygromyxa sp. WMMC2535]
MRLIDEAWQLSRSHIPCRTGPSRDLEESWEVHPESFTAMLVADLLVGQPEHRELVQGVLDMLEKELGEEDVFYFFKDHDRLPADADCTSVGLSVLIRGGKQEITQRAHRALDRILANSNKRGVVETYFDPSGERAGIIDPVVCANVLYLGHLLGRGDELEPTLRHVRRVLRTRSFVEGTRYYHSPDSFLYFLARVVRRFPAVHDALLEPMRDAVRERQGSTDYALDISQRVICANWLGIDDGDEARKLAQMQQPDDSWPADSLFRYGRKRIFFGSQALSTAFALRALRALDSVTGIL